MYSRKSLSRLTKQYTHCLYVHAWVQTLLTVYSDDIVSKDHQYNGQRGGCEWRGRRQVEESKEKNSMKRDYSKKDH